MPFDPLQSPVKEPIFRPTPRVRVFFRHEAANVKNQLPALDPSGKSTHHGGDVIARVKNADAFAPHDSDYGPGTPRHIVERSRQRGPLMVFQVVPAYPFGF